MTLLKHMSFSDVNILTFSKMGIKIQPMEWQLDGTQQNENNCTYVQGNKLQTYNVRVYFDEVQTLQVKRIKTMRDRRLLASLGSPIIYFPLVKVTSACRRCTSNRETISTTISSGNEDSNSTG